MKPIRWRVALVSFLTLAALYLVAPTIFYFLQPTSIRNNQEELFKRLPSWLPKQHVKLGLDLQGGVQLVLGVNTEGTVENRLGRNASEISSWAKDQKLAVNSAYVPKNSKTLVVDLAAEQDQGVFHEKLAKEFPLLHKLSRDGQKLIYSFKESEIERIKQGALEQAERVIRTRIDQWGVTEPMVNRRSDGSVLVQLPGFSNPQQAKELLGRTAQLKFKIVDDEFRGFDELKAKLPPGVTSADTEGSSAFASESKEDLIAFLKDKVPQDRELLFSRKQIGDKAKNKFKWTSYVVLASTDLMGDDVLEANLVQSTELDRRPAVSLRFTGLGGKKLAEFTEKYVKKRMAIVLDDVVESAPVISQKIAGGTAQITLGSGRSYNEVVEEGTQLALILKSGAIPATIQVLEERQVGASMGPELANQGLLGALVGLLCVFMFMLVYYRRPGALACLALALNALFLLAIMAVFGFALTLPGIAGFVLTLGMAVDANVLINERIRQELREGKHPRKALEAGFGKVFWTIIDSHVTTLIASVVLLETNNSGPIRGFAVTLIIGLLVSLFTSLSCTKLFFDIALRYVDDKKIKSWLGSAASQTKRTLQFNFMKTLPTISVVSISLVVFVLGATFIKGLNFGVDFAGGTEVTISFTQDVEPKSIREIAEKNGVKDLSLQALEGGNRLFLLRYEDKDSSADGSQASVQASNTYVAFKNALLSDLKEHGPEIQQVGFVGPQVGKELRNQGLISLLYAILAIVLYIAFRFDLRFAPGAIAKMLFDVFVILGFYVLFWQSFDLVAVAAFLTAVGYSINDTIVIYDRIRENLHDHPNRSLVDNVNISLNETLARSINTSLSTALSLVGMLVFSTGQIWTFAMAMLIGIISATLSSTFVSSGCVVGVEKWKKMQLKKKAALS
ncbi:MAG: protein translocase subunit SecD [Oligoflexales bacterium]|nr:protein translocase subunit SecD [Oligoflexales bacterium]